MSLLVASTAAITTVVTSAMKMRFRDANNDLTTSGATLLAVVNMLIVTNVLTQQNQTLRNRIGRLATLITVCYWINALIEDNVFVKDDSSQLNSRPNQQCNLHLARLILRELLEKLCECLLRVCHSSGHKDCETNPDNLCICSDNICVGVLKQTWFMVHHVNGCLNKNKKKNAWIKH